MSEKNFTNEVATMMKTLSPDEAKALLSKLKTDAIEAVKEEREQREAKREERADPKKLKKYLKDFDAEAGEPHKLYLQKRQELIEVTGWKKGDGLCPLHFARKPMGSQCFWAARWSTRTGILEPGDYYPLDKMTSTELLVEARDLCNLKLSYSGVRQPDSAFVTREILPIVEAFDRGRIPKLDHLKKKLVKVRGSYTEFIFPYDLPTHSYMVLVRPGWGDHNEILATMRMR